MDERGHSPEVESLAEVVRSAHAAGDCSAVALALFGGADADECSPMAAAGRPALCVAAELGFDEAVALLLAAGARADWQSRDAGTALWYAAREGRRESVRLLLAAGAATERKGLTGRTPLLEAINSGRGDDVIELLLAAGADPLACDTGGRGAEGYIDRIVEAKPSGRAARLRALVRAYAGSRRGGDAASAGEDR